MTYAAPLARANPSKPAVEVDALVECIQACFDCAQACTADADADLAEPQVQPMIRCIRLCLDCADVCLTTGAILSNQRKVPWLRVTRVAYRRHCKIEKPDSLRVDYECGSVTYSEWVCLEHPGYPRQKAVAWWRKRAPGIPAPSTVTEALKWVPALAVPTEILVEPVGQYHEIRHVRFAT